MNIWKTLILVTLLTPLLKEAELIPRQYRDKTSNIDESKS